MHVACLCACCFLSCVSLAPSLLPSLALPFPFFSMEHPHHFMPRLQTCAEGLHVCTSVHVHALLTLTSTRLDQGRTSSAASTCHDPCLSSSSLDLSLSLSMRSFSVLFLVLALSLCVLCAPIAAEPDSTSVETQAPGELMSRGSSTCTRSRSSCALQLSHWCDACICVCCV